MGFVGKFGLCYNDIYSGKRYIKNIIESVDSVGIVRFNYEYNRGAVRIKIVKYILQFANVAVVISIKDIM